MLEEWGQQADVVARQLASAPGPLERLARLADGCTHVVIAARGTSDNAARYAQYVLGTRNRLAVGLATPSLFGPFGRPPDLAGALLVAVSQSGQSPDLVGVVAEAARQGRPTAVVTNDPDSPLASAADVVVDLAAGPERAVAATKTYTASLVAMARISEALAGRDGRDLAAVPRALATAVDRAGVDGRRATAGLVDAHRAVVVARGHHLATAHEWALKLQELTYLMAQPWSSADFRHGPIAVVEPGLPVLVVATSGPTRDEVAELAGDVRRRGGHVVAIADDGTPAPPADVVVWVPRVPDWLAPVVAAPVLQRVAHDLAVARGTDPDAPRGLAKVTRTA